MSLPNVYQYYADIIPDLDKAEAVLAKPLATTLWHNPLKTNQADFLALMAKEGYALEPMTWHQGGYRYLGQEPLTKSWAYAAGLFQIQEEVSMLAGDLLSAEPGESVLDCCSAPGNKSAQIAMSMKNSGSLIANDINYGRMRAFGQITKRLGLINVSTTINDASSLPNVGEFFDRVLADVPCSCEGTFRKNPNTPDDYTKDKAALAMAKRQKDILLKAIKLCKPGGRIVYSTCTFSPYENEAVVSEVLEHWGDAISIVPMTVPGLTLSPGLTAWRDLTFDERMVHAMRLWPHINNTGGFFIAVLQKNRTTNRRPADVAPVPGDALGDYQAEVVERFGFPPSITQRFRFARLSNKGLYCINQDNRLPDRLKVDATGLFCLKTRIRFPKVSTAAAMLIGRYATKHVIELTAKQRDAYLQKIDIDLDVAQVGEAFTTGYAIVQYDGYCLGLGLYFSPNEQHEHVLRSLYRATLI